MKRNYMKMAYDNGNNWERTGGFSFSAKVEIQTNISLIVAKHLK